MSRPPATLTSALRALLALVFAACSPADTPPPPGAVRDSAGVQIVEFTLGDPASSRVAVSAEPTLRLGTEGDTTQEFNEIFGVTRLADGTTLVADNRVRLRAYAPDGRLLRTVGRFGGGPGEYELITWLARCGRDSVMVFDGGHQRMSVLTPRLDFVRAFRVNIPPDGGGPFATACGPDGGLAMLGWPRFVAIAEGAVVRHRQAVVAGDRTGAVRVLDSVPATEQFRAGPSIGPLQFGRITSIAHVARGIATATGDAHEVVVRDPVSGRVTQIVRAPAAVRVPVTDADLDAYADALAAERGAAPAEIRRRIRLAPYAREFPSMGQVAGDAAGRLWLERYPLPRDSAATWDVLAADGAYLGAARLPTRFHVREIGADYVAGTATDAETGIETVRVYAVRIAPPPP